MINERLFKAKEISKIWFAKQIMRLRLIKFRRKMTNGGSRGYEGKIL